MQIELRRSWKSIFIFPGSTLGALLLYLVVLGAVVLALDAANAAAASDTGSQKRFVNTVEAALPPGWTVLRTQFGTTPPDWYTHNDKSGVLLAVRKVPTKHVAALRTTSCLKSVLPRPRRPVVSSPTYAQAQASPLDPEESVSAKIWILPADWIGIRKVPNSAPNCVYWEGVLGGGNYKLVTTGGDRTFHEAFYDNLITGRSFVGTTSLVNGGYDLAMDIFRSKLQSTDKSAARLVHEYCKTADQLSEAAHSLIMLGVPAKSVIIRAAREVPDGLGRDCDALGRLGGADSRDILSKIVANPRLSDDVRISAARSLPAHADARIIAALLAGLKQSTDEEVQSTIAQALAHTRCKEAGPALLHTFRSIKNDHFKTDLGQALAAVRYTQAVPDLKAFEQRLLHDQPASPVSEMAESCPAPDPCAPPAKAVHLALLRLTGNWGKPGRTMRIHLIPPEIAVVGKEMPMIIYIENIGQEPFQSWSSPGSGLLIDGKRPDSARRGQPHPCGDGDGWTYEVLPGSMHAIGYDLSGDDLLPGPHTVKYVVKDAESNLAPFLVRRF